MRENSVLSGLLRNREIVGNVVAVLLLSAIVGVPSIPSAQVAVEPVGTVEIDCAAQGARDQAWTFRAGLDDSTLEVSVKGCWCPSDSREGAESEIKRIFDEVAENFILARTVDAGGDVSISTDDIVNRFAQYIEYENPNRVDYLLFVDLEPGASKTKTKYCFTAQQVGDYFDELIRFFDGE